MTNKAVLGCVALLLTGCAPKPAPRFIDPPPPALSAHIRFALTGTPRSLDVIPVTVRVTDAQGQPLSNARVSVDLSMPSMPMPDNKTFLRETGPGTYMGTVRFTMSGAWTATVTATKGGAQGTQTFPVTVQ